MRITKQIIETIIQRETEKKFGKQERELAHSIHADLTKLVEKSLPAFDDWLTSEGWVRTSNKVEFATVSNVRTCLSPTMVRKMRLSDPLPIPFTKYAHSISDVPKRVLNKIKKFSEMHDQKMSFERSLKMSLTAFNTSKKLLEHLPELKDYFKEEKQLSLLPVEDIKAIREQLVR